MAIRLADAARNAACNAIVDLLDVDAGAPTCKIYSGSQPADADDAASGTLLATFTLDATAAFGSAGTGTATLDATPVLSTTGAAAGTAGWFRFEDQSGDNVFDGSCGATGSGADLELSTTTITLAGTVQITSGTFTIPAG
jgi:hypothetical protein